MAPETAPENKAPQAPDPNDHSFLLEQKSFFQSLREQVRERFSPTKQAPLVLESTPIPVKDIWG
ncbi:MAG: hypothetical protein ACRD1E_07695, partial [Terriglobales bacterium]